MGANEKGIGMNDLKYNYHTQRDTEILNNIERTIKECIELLDNNEIAIVKSKLQELIIDKEWVANEL